MKQSDIQTSRYYVNESRGLVRETTSIHDDGHVEYFSYWLSDGVCDGVLGVCHKHTLARWASREATAAEVARMKRSEAKQRSLALERNVLARLSEASRTGDDPFEPYFPDGLTIRDEANALVAWAFRNGPLEDLHAGEHSELLDDSTLSRLTNEEMKALMIHACRELASLLELKAANPTDYERQIKSYNWRYCRGWET